MFAYRNPNLEPVVRPAHVPLVLHRRPWFFLVRYFRSDIFDSDTEEREYPCIGMCTYFALMFRTDSLRLSPDHFSFLSSWTRDPGFHAQNVFLQLLYQILQKDKGIYPAEYIDISQMCCVLIVCAPLP